MYFDQDSFHWLTVEKNLLPTSFSTKIEETVVLIL